MQERYLTISGHKAKPEAMFRQREIVAMLVLTILHSMWPVNYCYQTYC